MKLRNLTLTVGLLGVLFTNSVFALGMGEIKLNSSLNEPLDAEIKLLNVGDLGELEMLVGLGSLEDFNSAGIERLFMLTDLRFKVDMSVPDNPVLRVTSRKPIREPYLDFLLELQWPSGRLLREYTLLLDLPVYATKRAAAKKVKAASVSPQPRSQQVSATASSRAASSASDARSTSISTSKLTSNSNGGKYRVAPGETAWSIARKNRPKGATIKQSLAAIKQANPQGFINGNVNLLKEGAVLRIPSSADVLQLNPQQIKELTGFSLESAMVNDKGATESQLNGTVSKNTPVAVPVGGGGRLKLAVSDEENAAVSSTGLSDARAAGGTEKIENGFAVFQEELDKTQRENTELKARLANMEKQIATMGRLVEINDDSLRTAQVASKKSTSQQLASQQQDTSEAETSDDADVIQKIEGVDVTQETGVAEETREAVSSEQGLTSDAEQPLAGTQAEIQATEESKGQTETEALNEQQKLTHEEQTESPQSDKSGGFDIQYWIDLLLYPFIGLLAILLFVILFFKKRKQDEEPQEELSLKNLVEKETADEDDMEEIFDEEDKEVLEEVAAKLNEQELKSLQELELKEGEDVDPIGEADIHLSLDNHNKAESVLLSAIDASPENTALRLKLLEVYVSSNELNKFDAQYEALSGLNDSEAMVKADSLRAVGEDVAVDANEVSETEKNDFDLNLDLEGLDLDNTSLEATDLEDDDFDNIDLDEKAPDIEGDRKASLQEEVDLDSLASDIDAEMENIDLSEELELTEEVDLTTSIDLSENGIESISEPTSEALSEPAEESVAEAITPVVDVTGGDMDVLGGEDECGTKLELAKAYLDMGDSESAKDILDEVVSQGDDSQQQQARKLLESLT